MDDGTPKTASEFGIVRVHDNLVCTDHVRLEDVDMFVDPLRVNAYIKIGVRFFIKRPGLYFDHARLIYLKNERAIIAASALEINWLSVFQFNGLCDRDQFGHGDALFSHFNVINVAHSS